jgi:hypothetical protein
MSDALYSVVFKGEVATGQDPETVKARLAQLFKIDPAKAAALFNPKGVPIKKRLDEATAKKYQLAMQKAGAIAEVVPEQPLTPPREAPPTNDMTSTLPLDTQLMQRPDFPPEPKAPPKAPDLTVAEPGALLVEPRPVPEPDIDTSQLSMAEPGVILGEPREVAEPDIDISGLAVNEPG